jgi:RNA polymerase sigma-70 factor (ECF subfamily)
MKSKKTIKYPTMLMGRDNYLKAKEATDSDLIKMVMEVTPRAYRQIIKRYQTKLFSYLYRLVGNREETEDLLQNVFVKVYNNLNRFDQQKKFSSWIYRIAHNEAVNFLKKRGKKKFVSLEDVSTSKDKLEMSTPERSPADFWIKKELKKEVEEAMEKIPPKYKEVLVLRYFLDKSYEEMSEILGKPVNTVGTLLNRAKKKLLQVIGKSWK